VVKRLNTVHDDVIPYFEDAAKQLLETRDATRYMRTPAVTSVSRCLLFTLQ